MTKTVNLTGANMTLMDDFSLFLLNYVGSQLESFCYKNELDVKSQKNLKPTGKFKIRS